MQTLRLIAKNPAIVILMILTVMLFSCGQDTLRARTNQLTGKDLMRAVFFLDGEAADLVDPVKDLKLEAILVEGDVEQVRKQLSDILDQLEAQHPGTFQRFKADMTSGDHVRIEGAIAANARVLIDFLNEDKYVKQYTKAMEGTEEPLASLVSTHFPDKSSKLTPDGINEVLHSDDFKSDLSSYFSSLEKKLNGRSASNQEQTCVIIGAAVLIFAAIAVLVIYAVAVLNVAAAANYLTVTWQEEVNERNAGNSSLMRDQIVNSIAENWADIR